MYLNKIKKWLKLIDPTFIRGIAIGIVITIILVFIVNTDSLLKIFYGFIILVVLLLLGAIIGNYYVNRQKEKVQEILSEKTNELTNEIKDNSYQILKAVLSENKNEDIPKAFSKIKLSDSFSEILKLAVAFVTRFMAFGTLMSVLGGLISFAIFMATFLQVKHLEKQNELIYKQTKLIDTQNSLTESSRRSAVVFELSSVLDKIDEEMDQYDKRLLKQFNKNIQGIYDSIYKKYPFNKDQNIFFFAPHPNRNSVLNLSSVRFKFNYDKDFGSIIKVKLSDRLNGRIIALSKALKPYRYIDSVNKLLKIKRSPERGQLILALNESNVDLQGILKNADFTYSEINNTSFSSRIRYNDFKYEDFSMINLSNSFISKSLFRRINFTEASFKDMKGFNSNFIYSCLANSDFGNAYLKDITFRYCQLVGANFDDSVFENVRIFSSNLLICQFDSSVFNSVFIKNSILPEFIDDSLNFKVKDRVVIEDSYSIDNSWGEYIKSKKDLKFNIYKIKKISIKDSLTLSSEIINYFNELSSIYKKETEEGRVEGIEVDSIYKINLSAFKKK
ncbi:membrane protein of unknown function [Tenacibaculum sp. 190524A02b]|uniref:pentapeptide repeat-containing protein n=1 Tax=Tenacibaculum vairaonense TaxID=3137860 RepID=UPI0032B1CC49